MAEVGSRSSFPIAPGIVGLDLEFQGEPRAIGAYALVAPGGRWALVETGPESTLDNLASALEEAGLDLQGLEAILVTHIHLDHAGAAGALSARARSPVYVHPAGLPHLAEPSRLWQSASRLYGNRMERLWGSIRPVPPERLRAVEDGARLCLAGHSIEVYHTPGHASHHAVFLVDGDVLFSGDIAGVRFPGVRHVRSPAMPPELHVELWEASIGRIRSLGPRLLVPTHFGPFASDVGWHLDHVVESLRRGSEVALGGLRSGKVDDAIAAALTEDDAQDLADAGEPRAVLGWYEMVAPSALMALGYGRYWRKVHPERLVAPQEGLTRRPIPASPAVPGRHTPAGAGARAGAWPGGGRTPRSGRVLRLSRPLRPGARRGRGGGRVAQGGGRPSARPPGKEQGVG